MKTTTQGSAQVIISLNGQSCEKIGSHFSLSLKTVRYLNEH